VNYERNKKGARFFETQCRLNRLFLLESVRSVTWKTNFPAIA